MAQRRRSFTVAFGGVLCVGSSSRVIDSGDWPVHPMYCVLKQPAEQNDDSRVPKEVIVILEEVSGLAPPYADLGGWVLKVELEL